MTDQEKPGAPEGHEPSESSPPEQGTEQTGATSAQEEETFDKWTQGDEVPEQPEVSASKAKSSKTGFWGAKEKPAAGDTGGDWEHDMINRLAFASLNEQRRARRWSVFFKSLLFIYLFALLFYVPAQWGEKGISVGKHTALVEVEGVIAANTPANADNLVSGLRAAFKDNNTAGIILRINSPGGSPVQAGYVYDEIKRLREKHKDIKVYAVITDICASGGYYIASAADEIYANKASIVGSIGVLMDGFGFVGSLKKLGVERRLMTAGKHKGIMDPFSPLKKDEVAHVQGLLDGIHQQFINAVKEGRGDRLTDSPQLFSGLFWDGQEGVELGLVDGLGSSSYVAREIIGVEKIVDFTPRPSYLDRFADRIGLAMAQVMEGSLGLQGVGLR
jgi:protease-4